MKSFYLTIFILIFFAGESSAQWSSDIFTSPVAFGVHDTILFGYHSGGPIKTGIYRHDRSQPMIGTAWVEADTGIIPGSSILAFGAIGQYTMASGYRSSDGGHNWIATNFPDLPTCFLTVGQYLYAGGAGGVYRSTDSGMNWSLFSTSQRGVNSLAIVGTILFEGTNSGVYFSTNNGQNWSQTTVTAQVTSLAVADSVIVAGLKNNGIVRSTDGGANWVTAKKGPFNPTVNSLVTDGRNFFAGTGAVGQGVSQLGSGIFLSTDSGTTWDTANVNNGLPWPNINTLCIFDTFLIAGAWDNFGTYSYSYVRPLSEMVKKDSTSRVVNGPSAVADTIEIYPNPATGLVTINSEGISILGVSVMNVLGSETGAGVRGSGSGEISLDLSKLPSGTYFLQIETAKGMVMRKIVRK